MPTYQKTLVPDSSNAEAGGVIAPFGYVTESGLLIWEGADADGLIQIYAYNSSTGVTSPVSDNHDDHRAGLPWDSNDAGAVVFECYSGPPVSNHQCFLYDGTAATLIGGSNATEVYSPGINNDGDRVCCSWCGGGFGTWIFLTSGADQLTVAGEWDPRQHRFEWCAVNNNRDVCYLAMDLQTGLEQLHVWSQGNDVPLGGSDGHVIGCSMNNKGWVAWCERTGDPSHVIRGTFLYDGAGTTQVLPALADPLSFVLNDRGQFLYETGTCKKTDVRLWQNGTLTTVSATGKSFNRSASMNNLGEIVWSAGDDWPAETSTGIYQDVRDDIYYSDNGGPPELIASPGMCPTVNDLGQVVYWDPDARQLVLLTPTGVRPFFRRFWRYLLRVWIWPLWRPFARRRWLASFDRSRCVQPPRPSAPSQTRPQPVPVRPLAAASLQNLSARGRRLHGLGRPRLPARP